MNPAGTQSSAAPGDAAAEYVAGLHLAELLNVPSRTSLREALGDAIGMTLGRWHLAEVDGDYACDALEDALAVPVSMVAGLLTTRVSRAEVAKWSAETKLPDPHVVVHEEAQKGAAARAQADAELAVVTPVAGAVRSALAERADLFDSSEELRHIRTFAHARGAGEWATLGGVLLRAVLSIPHQVVLPPIIGGDMSLNLLLALAGTSGGGKDVSSAAADAAVSLRADGRPLHWTAEPLGTGEGLNRTYARSRKNPGTGRVETVFHQRAALFGARDIAGLEALKDRRGATLMSELLKAAHGQELGFANADADRRVILPAHSYRLALSIGVQPENGTALLADRARRDGLPQRFLWLPVRDGRRRGARPDEPEPLAIDVPQFGIVTDPLMLDSEQVDDGEPPKLVRLEVAESICRVIADTNDAKDADPFGRTDEPLAGHRLLAQLKTSAALAALHGRTAIGPEDWQRGGAVIALSEAVIAEVAELSIDAATRDAAAQGRLDGHRFAAADTERAAAKASVDTERVAAKLLEFLRGHNGDWCPNSAVHGSVTAKDRAYESAALAQLVKRGEIEAKTVEYQRNRFTNHYRSLR